MEGERSRLARRLGPRTVDSVGHRLENAVQPRHLAASIVALAAAATTAGCGGSDAHPTAARSGSPNSLTISNFKFTPASLTVSPGARIRVTNRDTTAHTATADDGRSFDTGDIDPGSAATIALSKAGTYKFHCSIHPFMHGTVVVH
jgi:plastocyanin